MGFFAMSIVEMQEYARKKNIDLPLDASKSEILEIILPHQLDDTSMMDIKNIALKNCIKIPTSKNKGVSLPSAIAWLDASMITYLQPNICISDRYLYSILGSGVVIE